MSNNYFSKYASKVPKKINKPYPFQPKIKLKEKNHNNKIMLVFLNYIQAGQAQRTYNFATLLVEHRALYSRV